MIEIQTISNILTTKQLDVYLRAGITPEYFSKLNSEYKYILAHYKKYEAVPDTATFLNEFPDFTLLEVDEPVNFIIDNLKENYVYLQGCELITNSVKKLERNSYDGLRDLVAKAQDLLKNTLVKDGVDINSNEIIERKLQLIEERRTMGGILGISSGLTELDNVLNGWLPGEELVTIVGRVNQGKSWLLQKFLNEANKQGKKVLLYSGEMSPLQVSFRNDTLGLHYSNRQLTKATISDTDLQQYSVDLLNNNSPEFRVITPNDLGGKPLTITMLESYINSYKPDLVGIDQISLMQDERAHKGDATRTHYTHIAQDLFNLSTKYKIPVLADAQANRNKSDVKNPENPELADIGESDGIAQNSSRVISLVQVKNGLSLKITKNRYGENNRTFIYTWDIDLGTFVFSCEQLEDDTPKDNSLPLRLRNSENKNNSLDSVF